MTCLLFLVSLSGFILWILKLHNGCVAVSIRIPDDIRLSEDEHELHPFYHLSTLVGIFNKGSCVPCVDDVSGQTIVYEMLIDQQVAQQPGGSNPSSSLMNKQAAASPGQYAPPQHSIMETLRNPGQWFDLYFPYGRYLLRIVLPMCILFIFYDDRAVQLFFVPFGQLLSAIFETYPARIARNLYLHGPAIELPMFRMTIGGWRGASHASICTALHGQTETYWLLHATECDIVVDSYAKKFASSLWFVVMAVMMYQFFSHWWQSFLKW